VKKVFDLSAASIALLLLLPILIILALLIRIKLGTPIFFKQTRPGLYAQPFQLIKFRSMRNTHDTSGELLPDSERLTTFGKWIRSTSLDELPELWNVLKGDMSLVGPRPLLMEYLTRYSPEQARRQEVKPGITGWAQVNGRNAISWEEKFRMDVWYVDHQSFCLDVKILFLTVQSVITRRGITSEGKATMPAFKGNTLEK
jgi:lipopolysaccharide/colanic/teichoic acid biosynthesis glycosyltransferase